MGHLASNIQRHKEKAAWFAVDFVQPGMIVGLGHGSTAVFAVRCIAQRFNDGRLDGILAVACSLQVEEEARRLGIPLTTLEKHGVVDITIDGSDEVDPYLNLIKGGGGALLREKIVAQASRREVIVVDESKLSPALGTKASVPVEVVPFGWKVQVTYLRSLGSEPVLRLGKDREPFVSDHGNVILDCHFPPIDDPARLAAQFDGRAGIVEHGLFLGLATDVVVSGPAGVRHLRRAP